MNKAEVYAEFDIDEWGTIRNPGKFESERWYAPIVYEWMLEGDGEYLDEGVTIFDVDASEREQFDLSDEHTALVLEVSDQGFVSVSAVTDTEVERLREIIDEGYDETEDID